MKLYQIQIRSIQRDMEPVIKLAPNLTKLTIELNLNIVEDIHRLPECLFSITKLDLLDIQIESSYSNENFKDILSQLMTLNPNLKNLSIALNVSDWLDHALSQPIRRGMKYFRLKGLFADCKIEVKGKTMVIKNLKPSFTQILNKFPQVKWIRLITDDRRYISKARREFRVMERDLPRNKWIQFLSSSYRSRSDR